jgi:pilus assembly protein CpaC
MFTGRDKKRWAMRSGGLGALLLAVVTCAAAQQSGPNAPTTTADGAAHSTVTIPTDSNGTPLTNAPAAVPLPQGEAAQSLHLLVGRSLLITSPVRIKQVSLADPSIADVLVVSPNQVMLNGKTPGGVSLVIWDESGQSQTFEINVDVDVLGLRQELKEAFPNEQVQVDTARDMVILSGKASSQEVADKMLDVVKGVTGKATSLVQVPPVQTGEILLEVKFAEVSRSVLSQLGINILSLPGAKNVGTISTQQFSPPVIQGQVGSIGGPTAPTTTTSAAGTTTTNNTSFGLGDLMNIFLLRQDINLAATIQALQQQNLMQILAEPNVLTESGKEASFLAGGEFPFPVVQGLGAGALPTITIQFKEFGVRLNFTPNLTSDGLIHLKVQPEVSALDFSNALTISGFTIPALSTRRVQSDMALRDGQTFAIAGLMDNRVTQQMSKIPGIGDIPILGLLFRSRQLQKSDDELLIVVTPRVVHPLEQNAAPALPPMPKPFMPPLNPKQDHTPGGQNIMKPNGSPNGTPNANPNGNPNGSTKQQQ